MTNREVLELRVLGPLEARVGGAPVPLGGAKQRVVLATLLLRTDEVVTNWLLIDEIWGDDAPPSAAHSLEVYISRLRRLCNGHGPSLVRSGPGYSLQLGAARLDAQRFERLAADVARAWAASDHERASEVAAEALALWRGPVLADVELGPVGRGEAERLEELRLRTLELRFDAELTLGRHEQAVSELQATVRQNPYRERFVAQLMLALYRSGRQAEALQVYEQTRRRLDDELGLLPSADLQQLSARIVRQEPGLHQASLQSGSPQVPPGEHTTRRISGLAIASAAVVATMALAASGGASQPSRPFDPTTQRVALVLPTEPRQSAFEESVANNRMKATASAFDSSAARHGLEARTLSVDEVAPDSIAVDRLLRQIEAGRFDLVLVQSDRASARLLAPRISTLPTTRFVFIDTSLEELSLEGVRNATAVRFALESPARIAGYAGGLVPPRRDSAPGRPDMVSVVAGLPSIETRRVIAGFKRGVHEASAGIAIRVDYARETNEPTVSERLANEQIDAGSDVVFAIAGLCGLGAAAVARARGVWVAGEDEYGISEQPWVLASLFKDYQRAPHDALDAFVAGTLPAGRDVELGLEDEYAIGTTLGSGVPSVFQSKVVAFCSKVRLRAKIVALPAQSPEVVS